MARIATPPGRPATAARALRASLLTVGVAWAAAGTAGQASGERPVAPFIYPCQFAAGSCLPYGPWAGWVWAWEGRRPWKRPVAPDPPSFTEQDIWGSTGSPWGYVRRLPPPTPESQIQPRYRDASTLREEFDTR